MSEDDDAYFPKPRAKGGYRELADEPRVHELEVALEPAKRPVVVTRPETQPDAERRAASENAGDRATESLRTVMRNERAYWGRYSTFRRYPRASGAVLVVIGGFLTWGELDTLLHGGFYTKAAFIGPLALSSGAFPLVFGMPVDENGIPPGWWKVGFGVAIGVGAVMGIVLLMSLATS
jgi:hypothetical protein